MLGSSSRAARRRVDSTPPGLTRTPSRPMFRAAQSYWEPPILRGSRESSHLRPRVHPRPATRKPASRAPQVHRGPRLDRLGRNLKHLIILLDELQALGVAFVSLNEGIDATTPAGRLQVHVLGAIAEFERGRIVERVKAGIARARAQGKRLGRQPVPTNNSIRTPKPFGNLFGRFRIGSSESCRELRRPRLAQAR
jgi:hypothetical protein